VWFKWVQISTQKGKYRTGVAERSLCRGFFPLLFMNQGSMEMLDWSEALQSNI